VRRIQRREKSSPTTDEQTDKRVTEDTEIYLRLGEFYEEAERLFAPYLSLHQKLPFMWWPFPTPTWLAKLPARLKRPNAAG
jgi:hypothetical protein